jgi:pimeloyl-ACP methyl ester carboxylesterase
MNPDHI